MIPDRPIVRVPRGPEEAGRFPLLEARFSSRSLLQAQVYPALTLAWLSPRLIILLPTLQSCIAAKWCNAVLLQIRSFRPYFYNKPVRQKLPDMGIEYVTD